MRANNWDDARKCRVVPAYLRDAALEAYRSIDLARQGNYHHLVDDMKERLEPPDIKRFKQTELNSRVQGKNESVLEFAASIQKFVRGAYPDYDEAARNDLLFTNFTNKLKPSLRPLVMMFEPGSFRDAVVKAQKLESQHRLMEETAMVNTLGQVSGSQAMSTDPAIQRLCYQMNTLFGRGSADSGTARSVVDESARQQSNQSFEQFGADNNGDRYVDSGYGSNDRIQGNRGCFNSATMDQDDMHDWTWLPNGSVVPVCSNCDEPGHFNWECCFSSGSFPNYGPDRVPHPSEGEGAIFQ